MKIVAFALLALICAGVSTFAKPVEMSLARDWINHCDYQASRPYGAGVALSEAQKAQCRARILGEVDGVIAGMKLSKRKPWICLPVGIEWPEKFAVVRKYVNDHPEAMSADLGDVVAAALANSYPCH